MRSSGAPVRITATLAEQLRLLIDEPGRGDRLAVGLSRLGRDVALAVPSFLAASIVLARLGGEISISTVAGAAEPAVVLASLAVPLPGATSGDEPSDILVLRAGATGAFLLLADDLDGLLGRGHPTIDVDKHLGFPPAPTTESFAASLADLRVVDQAVGVLVDRGLHPDAAGRELQRWAGDGDTTVSVVSRALLASLRTNPGRD
jgi:hypothetical protein